MATRSLESELRLQLKALLAGGQAHATLEEAVAAMPFTLQGVVPDGLPYSAWQLLEHLRIAQRDILSFSNNSDGHYKPLAWPKDYWPEQAAPPDEDAWQRSVETIRQERMKFERLLADGDLTLPFPWGEGQNLLREALLIADHEAYHAGELILLRRLLGAWKPKEGHT